MRDSPLIAHLFFFLLDGVHTVLAIMQGSINMHVGMGPAPGWQRWKHFGKVILVGGRAKDWLASDTITPVLAWSIHIWCTANFSHLLAQRIYSFPGDPLSSLNFFFVNLAEVTCFGKREGRPIFGANNLAGAWIWITKETEEFLARKQTTVLHFHFIL